MVNQHTQENHYVPQSYLRRWAGTEGKIWASRLLVPDDRMPLWKYASVKGVAKHQNLYTRMVAGRDTDEMERWLNDEFESPAQASIAKAISGDRLSDEDWRLIIRFVAAQDVRTPAKLHEAMKRWESGLQPLIDEVLEDSVMALTESKKSGALLQTEPHPYSDYFPIKVTKNLLPEAEFGTLHVETIAGRGLWLFSLKHLLTQTIQALHRHKWTILVCPQGVQWLTSDDPVIKLNFVSDENYNFRGGWGSRGTEILMPLGPQHLLYTRIGSRPPQKGTVLSIELAQSFQKFTVEHAHRFVYSTQPDEQLPKIRPRHVSAEAYDSEAKQWMSWHIDQTKAEQELLQGR
jgi:hypothetical protein